MSTFAHHGIIYVPLGFAQTFSILSTLDEVRGGSAWGAGTFAVRDPRPSSIILLCNKSQADNVLQRPVTGPASHPRSSSNLPRRRARSFTRPSPRSTLHDYMAAPRARRRKRPSVALLRMERRHNNISSSSPRPKLLLPNKLNLLLHDRSKRNSRLQRSRKRGRRMRSQVLAACLSNVQ